jgi:hypothetical protein
MRVAAVMVHVDGRGRLLAVEAQVHVRMRARDARK